MERVTFLIEATGERIGCLLNPNTLVMRRTAGVRPLPPSIGQLAGNGISDDPLLHTGGGRTEIELDLLFDVGLAGSTITTDDVRDLTRPLWNLTENSHQIGTGVRHAPVVRFVWGKAWNVPAVVTAIAERLEEFAPSGAAQRSWVRLRLVRVPDTAPTPATSNATLVTPAAALAMPDGETEPLSEAIEEGGPGDVFHEVIGGGPSAGTGERIDEIAARYYGDPAAWRILARANGIDNPTELNAGGLLRIPVLPSVRRSSTTKTSEKPANPSDGGEEALEALAPPPEEASPEQEESTRPTPKPPESPATTSAPDGVKE